MRKLKKTIKKVLAFLMIIILSATGISTKTLAAESSLSKASPTIDEMKKYLLDIGTEQEFLDDISENRIKKLYQLCFGKEVTCLGYKTQIVEIQEENPKMRNQILTSELKLGINIYEFTSNGKITALNVSTSYEWLSDPILHWTDAHTFTFDGTKFKIGGIYAESGYQISGQWFPVATIDAPATAADGGLGWYLSTAKGTFPNSALNSGGAEIYLIPRNGSTTKDQLSSSMYYTYAHQLIGTSISLSPSGGSVSISGGSYEYQTKIYNY